MKRHAAVAALVALGTAPLALFAQLRGDLRDSLRRRLLFAVTSLIVLHYPAALAAGTVPRIGWLSNGAPDSYESRAIVQGLKEAGLVDGRTIEIVHRASQGDAARLRAMATELVDLKVALILAPDPPSVMAARAATSVIPIVMRVSFDPVKSGLVRSLPHPGGNVTGVYSNVDELVGKRLEVLREAIPGLVRVAVLWDSEADGSRRSFATAQRAAAALGLDLQSIETHGAHPDFDAAILRAVAAKAQGLITLRNPHIVRSARALAALTARHRLPAIFDEQVFVEGGGLMSYGADLRELNRHLATYVDKLLKGARPGDLPVEQPLKFELVINLPTAKSIGVKIPQSILLRADRVIE